MLAGLPRLASVGVVARVSPVTLPGRCLRSRGRPGLGHPARDPFRARVPAIRHYFGHAAARAGASRHVTALARALVISRGRAGDTGALVVAGNAGVPRRAGARQARNDLVPEARGSPARVPGTRPSPPRQWPKIGSPTLVPGPGGGSVAALSRGSAGRHRHQKNSSCGPSQPRVLFDSFLRHAGAKNGLGQERSQIFLTRVRRDLPDSEKRQLRSRLGSHRRAYKID